MGAPLLRRHVASVSLLYFKAGVTLLAGLWLAFGPDSAFAAPAWARAFNSFSRQWWGAGFVVCAFGLGVALWRRRDADWVIFMVAAQGVIYLFFALVFLSFALSNRGVGMWGALLCTEIAGAHLLIAWRLIGALSGA